MADKFKLLQLPTHPIQKHIPTELEMAREIARENVSSELLKVKFEDAGYEVTLEEDGDVYILRTGVNLRIINFPDHACLQMRGNLTLNNDIADEDLKKFVTRANYESFMVRYVGHRWDNGEVALFGNYTIYYPFGLNMPNLIFSARRLIENIRVFYEENKTNEVYFPKND